MANLTVRVEVDSDLAQRALRRLGAQATAALAAGMLEAGEVIAEAADGKLGREANLAEAEAKATNVRIGPESKKFFYRFLELGTSPHVIRPSERKALQLALNGLPIVRSVRHPGMQARPFLRPALDENIGAALDEAGKKVRDRLEAAL